MLLMLLLLPMLALRWYKYKVLVSVVVVSCLSMIRKVVKRYHTTSVRHYQ